MFIVLYAMISPLMCKKYFTIDYQSNDNLIYLIGVKSMQVRIFYNEEEQRW